MFTGIVGQLGVVKKIEHKSNLNRLAIALNLNNRHIDIGDSISVNGVCLSISSLDDNLVFFDVIEETLSKSNLSFLDVNDKVNIEFSLRANDSISGHFVTGHIDCLGKVMAKRDQSSSVYFEISIPTSFNKYIVSKASITVNGVSLTIATDYYDYFSFFCIPHTLDKTNLKDLKVDDQVNVEFDILAKYVQKNIQPSNPTTKLSIQYLKEKGFV